MSAKLTAEQVRFGITKAQIAALRQLAEPPAVDRVLHLTFSNKELANVGAAFMQLTAMGYAKRKKVAGGWYQFQITQEGRKKWAEVQDAH